MGTSALMSLGMRAMTANYAALQTTGNNIANANVEGYSRQQAELTTASGQFSGAGFFGKGVDVATVTRAHDAFLTREAATSRSLSELDRARLDQLTQLEAAFPMGEQGIGYAAGQLLNSMVDLASRPQDLSTRQVVLSRAAELASRFDQSGAQLDRLQAGVTQDLKNSVGTVNDLARRVAQLNEQIAASAGMGHTPNDLLDQRDQLVSQISGFVQISTIPASDGTLGVFIAGGQRLVLGNQASTLAITPDVLDASRSAVGMVENGSTRPLPADLLSGGSIAGLLRFQNEDLRDGRNLLGQMAAAISASVNAQQSLGLDLRTPPGSGAPIFGVGAPQALAAASNARDAAGNFVSSVSLTVADASQLQASDYLLQPDPAAAGSYVVTRLSDGLVRSVASGGTLDGMTITAGSPAPAAGERFLLQPVARAANGMRCVLADPKGLAAASPLVATAAAANTGTASVGSLTIVDPSADPQNTATIAFTSATGDYAWQLRDRTTNALVASGTGTWTPGQPIGIAGFALQLSGVPANGDGFSVAATPNPASNNGNALALAALRDAALVGRNPGAGATITDAYASAMSDIGVRVQGARIASEMSSAASDSAHRQLSDKTGVNLDEEAARLIQFQQSYQAAAKVLQIGQSIFDTLLQTAGGR